MDSETLKTQVFDATFKEEETRKLSCPDAFALAAAHNIDLFDIAQLCNQEGIKIVQCQLGCFT